MEDEDRGTEVEGDLDKAGVLGVLGAAEYRTSGRGLVERGFAAMAGSRGSAETGMVSGEVIPSNGDENECTAVKIHLLPDYIPRQCRPSFTRRSLPDRDIESVSPIRPPFYIPLASGLGNLPSVHTLVGR